MRNNVVVKFLIFILLFNLIVTMPKVAHANDNLEVERIDFKDIIKEPKSKEILSVNTDINNKNKSMKEDINLSGSIDIVDLSEVASLYNKTDKDKEYRAEIDINSDKIVDLYDLIAVSKKIGIEPFILVGTYEEDNALVSYSGEWEIEEDKNHSNGKIKLSNKNSSSFEVRFFGTGVDWYGLYSEISGQADVYIDGEKKLTKDQYLWDNYYNKLAFSIDNLSLGIHTLRVENIAVHNENSTGTNVSIDRVIVKNSNIYNKDFRIYQTTDSGDIYVGQYTTFEESKKHANLYYTTYVLNSKNEEIWVNAYRAVKGNVDGTKEEVGRYMALEDAVDSIEEYTTAYVLDLAGEKIWSNNYELWVNGALNSRVNSLEDGKKIAVGYDNSFIKDKSGNIVWENKFSVFQITETGQTKANIGEYRTLSEAKIRSNSFYNTYILNGMEEEIWTNSFYVFQEVINGTISVGRYDTIDSAKAKASNFKNAYVKDASGKEIWRARYEAFQYDNFIGRFNTLDDAISYAGRFDHTLIKDVTDSDKIVWRIDQKDGYIVTSGAALNVRSGPGTQYSILGKLSNGEKVTIIDSSDTYWYKIRYGTGYGYVNKSYVSATPTQTIDSKVGYVSISGDTLNVRIGANTSFAKIGELRSGESVEIVDSSDTNWYKIKFNTNNGPYGYVYKQYITFSKPSNTQISASLVEFIKAYEGFYSRRYICPGGVPTIGYGHVIKQGEYFDVITKEQATEILKNELKEFENQVNYLCKSYGVNLNQQEFDSLVSFSFNIGIGGLKKSTLFKNIRDGVKDVNIIKENFRAWRMASGKPLLGLERRRLDEWQMYFYGNYYRDNLI